MESCDSISTDETSSSSFSSSKPINCLSSLSSSSSSKPTESSSSLLSISPKPTITKTTSNKRKAINCDVLLHTNLNDELVRFSGKTTEHSHLPNPAELEIRNLKEVMRQRAENELAPLLEIAEQRMKELYDRFNNNRITAQDLLRALSFFVANEK
ncbi:unnamed protein product [Rotaria sp. Silwood1]|nr:unnamed protein product [Rotaria sp. Silwood1]CAF3417846.1 unnamed protein product [Rotaria sp. Silwood1]CAF4616162.1 unnamed protein product [Rotaria sp. Silwood1]